jgi:hypothetical protein
MMRFASLALLAATAMADSPVPNQFVGTWTGQRSQLFALTVASNPNSWECMANQQRSDRPVTITIGSDSQVRISAVAQQTFQQGAGTYTIPAVAQQSFVWANWDASTGIAQLRLANNLNQIQCFYLNTGANGGNTTTGSANGGNSTTGTSLTLVVLGGQAISQPNGWQLQCQQAQYAAIPNVRTQPSCTTSGQNNSPVNSTILYQATFQGSAVAGNGVGATLLSAAAAAVGVGAAALLL